MLMVLTLLLQHTAASGTSINPNQLYSPFSKSSLSELYTLMVIIPFSEFGFR